MKNILIVGINGVGKTSLLNILKKKGEFFPYHLSSHTTFSSITINNKKIPIYDTTEHYLTKHIISLINLDSIIIVCFSVDYKYSYVEAKRYIEKIRKMFNSIDILLVGNKTDISSQRKVPDVETIVSENPSVSYYELSCKTNDNVHTFINHLERIC